MLKYFSFFGRAKRKEYWLTIVILFVIALLLQILFFPLLIFFAIPAVWINLAVTARRLRDAGWNPWLTLLLFAPVVNLAAWIAFGCLPSKK